VNQAMFEALHIPVITVDNQTAINLLNGKSIEKYIDVSEITNNDNLAIFRRDESFVGIIRKENGHWQYGYMYATVSM
jgi:hypothetical protein